MNVSRGAQTRRHYTSLRGGHLIGLHAKRAQPKTSWKHEHTEGTSTGPPVVDADAIRPAATAAPDASAVRRVTSSDPAAMDTAATGATVGTVVQTASPPKAPRVSGDTRKLVAATNAIGIGGEEQGYSRGGDGDRCWKESVDGLQESPGRAAGERGVMAASGSMTGVAVGSVAVGVTTGFQAIDWSGHSRAWGSACPREMSFHSQARPSSQDNHRSDTPDRLIVKISRR